MSKGKATRSSTATSSTPAPAPAISNDILTGRFTELEWNAVVDVEDGEELVGELINTILDGVLGAIHEKHMETNLIPFSLDWAENIMEKLIDWQFLVHDPGEKDEDNWLPDQEAARVPLDSWARGSVPSRIIEEVEEKKEEFTRVENDKRKQSDSLQHEATQVTSEYEELSSMKNNPDLYKLNQLRETLKYYKISSDDLCTLEKIEKPSESLHLLYQALGILQEHPSTSYEYRNAIANLQDTKQFIETFGPRPISQSTLAQLKPYVENITLHPDHLTQLASPATRGLCTWLHSVYTFQTLCDSLNVETSIDIRTLRGSIIELKSLACPPRPVVNVMCAVTSLLQGKIINNFATAKAKFADTFLLEQLEKFDCSTLSHKFTVKFKNHFMTCTTAELKAVSVACSYLYQWCEDQIYGSGSIIVHPPQPTQAKKVRRKVKLRPSVVEREEIGDQKAAQPDNMMPHQSTAIVKAQQGRPPGRKEVQYDDRGNVISVMKIKKFPANRVRTTYEILDTTLPSKKNQLKPLKAASSLKTRGSYMYETQDHTPVPPSFVDAVTASPGVIIKQGSKIKRGPESVVLSPIEQSRYQNILSSSS